MRVAVVIAFRISTCCLPYVKFRDIRLFIFCNIRIYYVSKRIISKSNWPIYKITDSAVKICIEQGFSISESMAESLNRDLKACSCTKRCCTITGTIGFVSVVG